MYMYMHSLIYREELSCELAMISRIILGFVLSPLLALSLSFRAVNLDLILDLAPQGFLINA